ncbi:hypothetical protein L53_04110 [Hyphomonas sp. L-53-1-40]|nr:hypothetical protein L53_04110 [Hyphomonas sp. L-53-1-40]
MTKTFSFELPSQVPAEAETEGNNMPTDLKSLLGAVYRRFWLIALSFLSVFTLVAYMTFNQTPLYQSSSVVQLDTEQQNVIDLGSVLSGLAVSTAVIDTEVMIMKSKSLLTKVAVKQKLIEDPEFNWTLRERKTSALGKLKNQVKSLVGMDTRVVDPFEGMSVDERESAILDSVVGTLMGRVGVSRIGTTYLINVQVTSTSPETSARLANAIADQYRVQQLETKLDATRRATEWLSDRVFALREEVEEKENRVAKFIADNDMETAMGNTLTEQNIAYLTTQKTQAEVELNRVRSRFDSMRRQINSGAGVDGISEVLESPLITSLKQQLSTVRGRVGDLETRLGPQHPELIGARAEQADIERQIQNEMTRIATNLENEVRVRQDQVSRLQSQISNSNSKLRGNSLAMVRLRELERDAETSRVLYEEFIARSKETREQDGLVQPDAVILSNASVPKFPSSPRTTLNLLIGAILGCLLGGALAIMAEMFDMKISSSEDIEKKLAQNALGTVPLIRTGNALGFAQTNPADYLIENPLSAFAESIRYLRAAIAFSDLDSETKTVAITSSLPDEGKTSLTLALGRMSAMSGARTLVIDGDFRRRQLTDAAGLKPEIGFIEYLFGAGQLSDAISKDPKSMLDILPLSLTGHTPHDVFGTRAFDDLLVRLRSMYDLILIDTGPLLLMAEARVVAGKTDKAILVVRWRHTNRSAARQSLALLRSFKADLLGVTLNMVNLNRRRHYSDPGAGYDAYRKYYQMETKPSLFSFMRRDPNKPKKGEIRPTAIQTPPSLAEHSTESPEKVDAN